jgi:hypothetical protein
MRNSIINAYKMQGGGLQVRPRVLRPLVVICILVFWVSIGFAQAFSQAGREGKQVRYEKLDKDKWFSSHGTRCFGWL